MSIANQQAFPGPPVEMGDGSNVTCLGMTYHQWLVGQAVAGCLAYTDCSGVQESVAAAFATADAICAEYDRRAEKQP